MARIFGAVSVLIVALVLQCAQSTPAHAQVIINNVLSPFTTLQIGLGHRVYAPSPWAYGYDRRQFLASTTEVIQMFRRLSAMTLILLLAIPAAHAQRNRDDDSRNPEINRNLNRDGDRDRDRRDGVRNRDRDRNRDSDRRRDLVLLGEKTVGFDVDHDVINVSFAEDWFRERSFRALYLAAERNDVHLMRIRVKYFNDFAEEFNVDKVIRAGDQLAVDLGGERSYIRQIEMTYRSGRGGADRAVMRVFGEPFRVAGPIGPSANQRPPSPPNNPRERAEWVELGCRQVSLFRGDRDVIEVGRREGRFRAIRLNARENNIEVLDLKVIYANGEPDDIPVRRLLRAGERTPPLDLKGSDRSINRIEVVYRTLVRPSDIVTGERVRRATVCVDGMQFDEPRSRS